VVALLAALAAVLVLVWAGISASRIWKTDTHGAKVTETSIESKAVPGEHPVSVVVPEGAGDGERGMLVFLHGRSGDDGSYTDDEEFFEALADQGDKAPIVVFPDGGESSYWHDRDTGKWGSYVTDEVIPQMAEKFGADPDRIAIGGISMGGFGALDLAEKNPGMFCAVGGHSPALFLSGGESAPGAFDDAEDFDDNDVLSTAANDPDALSSQPVWLDAGKSDPFVPGVTQLADSLESAGVDATVKLNWPGGHDEDYWNAHWDEYLGFYAGALADC
jgi:S-formylglutathione hydrolase FrmB